MWHGGNFREELRGGLMRIETTLTDELELKQLEWVRSTLGVKKNAAVLRDALVLLAWAVREIMEGRRIASIDRQGSSLREFSSPLLDRATWLQRDTIELTPDGFARVAELVSTPPAPTGELRELLREKDVKSER